MSVAISAVNIDVAAKLNFWDRPIPSLWACSLMNDLSSACHASSDSCWPTQVHSPTWPAHPIKVCRANHGVRPGVIRHLEGPQCSGLDCTSEGFKSNWYDRSTSTQPNFKHSNEVRACVDGSLWMNAQRGRWLAAGQRCQSRAGIFARVILLSRTLTKENIKIACHTRGTYHFCKASQLFSTWIIKLNQLPIMWHSFTAAIF